MPDDKLTEIIDKIAKKACEVEFGEMVVKFKIHEGKVVGATTSLSTWEMKLG